MTGEVLLSRALIMWHAQEDIIPCLESCAETVDEMVICDTGSWDASVAKARKFLRKYRSGGHLVLVIICSREPSVHSRHRWLSPADYSCWLVVFGESLPHGDISMDSNGV